MSDDNILDSMHDDELSDESLDHGPSRMLTGVLSCGPR
jgi:hypothetical protein